MTNAFEPDLNNLMGRGSTGVPADGDVWTWDEETGRSKPRATSDFTLWSPDAQPFVPGPLDYEHGDGLSGWSVYDHDDEIIAGENDAGLFIHVPAHNAEKVVGLYKPLAALGSQYSVWTKFCLGAYYPGALDPTVGGITLWEDATDYSKRVFMVGTSWPPQISFTAYDNYNTVANGQVPVYLNPVMTLWFRFRQTAAAGFAIDVASNDGLSGGQVADDLGERAQHLGALSTYFIPFTPQHIGLAFDANYAALYDGGNIWVTGPTFQYFRSATSDVGWNAPFAGARVKGSYA